jgi:uncharacterized protein DUF5681
VSLPPAKKRRGPGRPFEKGASGNPAGGRRGSRPRVLVALDALGEGRAEEIITAIADRAAQGDTAAAALILSRVWPQRKGRPTPLPLPAVRTAADTTAALGAVVAAVAEGTLTPDEAQSVSAVLEVQRKAIETQELERRIVALEAAKEGGA